MKKLLTILLTIVLFASVMAPAASAASLVTVYVDTPQYSAGRTSAANDTAAINAIAAAMKAQKDTVDLSIYHISTDDIENVFMRAVFMNPQYFYIESGFYYSYNQMTNTIVEIQFMYIEEDAAVIAAQEAQLDDAVSSAMAGVSDEMSDVDKVLYFHDYLANIIDYDYENYLTDTLPDTVYTAYGAMVLRSAVCQGYSEAFILLCNQVGLETSMIVSDPMNHAWNAVKLDGQWYYVDITHDDVISQINGSYVYRTGINHNRLLLSESELSAAGYYGWYSLNLSDETVSASSSFADGYIWEGVTSPMFFDDGLWYYEKAGVIYSSGIDSSDQTVLFDKSADFDAYSAFAFDGSRIYYNNNDHVYSLNIRYADDAYNAQTDSDAYTKTLISIDDGILSGISYAGGQLEYEQVASDGDYSLNTYVLNDIIAADNTDEKIDAVSSVTLLSQKADVIAARASYDSLTADQKAFVLSYITLEEAEKQIYLLQYGVLWGDVDEDDQVTVADVVAMREIIMDGTGDEHLAAADMNGDGFVSVSDVIALRVLILSGAAA